MKITTEKITLLRTAEKSFTGSDGLVEYTQAVLLDDEGNKFEMSVAKEAKESVMTLGEKVDGVASIEAFIARGKGGNGSVVKFRLLGFKKA